MKSRLFIRKIHKWLGLILGIQIFLWFLSGFLMSFMPIDEVRGDHLLSASKPQAINLNNTDLSAITAQVSSPILSIAIKPWLGQTVIQVITEQEKLMFSATNMQTMTPINESVVSRILKARLKPPFEVRAIERLTKTPNEARGRIAPLWVATLNDTENSRIYISEQTGEIVAKRTDRWRLFDFLWMLHIMDYDEREDFNHPLLYLTALSALLFTLTGFVLVYFSLRRK